MVTYCRWFRYPNQPPFGCIQPCKSWDKLSTSWWPPDFWTINSIPWLSPFPGCSANATRIFVPCLSSGTPTPTFMNVTKKNNPRCPTRSPTEIIVKSNAVELYGSCRKKSVWLDCMEKYVNICVYKKFIITYIYIHTWNPSQHCFGWKCLVLRVYLQKLEVAWALGIYEGVRILKDNKSPMYKYTLYLFEYVPSNRKLTKHGNRDGTIGTVTSTSKTWQVHVTCQPSFGPLGR